jgi:uncharacterized delta-60 repeat protein
MSTRRAALPAVAAAIVLALAAARVATAAGTVDAGFGSGGAASVPFGPGARAAGVALTADGRIVVAGDRRAAGGESALTARFTPAGALDGSFAGTGARVDAFATGASPQRGGAVAAQPDGATIVAGVAGEQWSLARFLPTGLTDGLFGAGGVTLRDPTPSPGPPEEYPNEEPAPPDGTGPAAIAITPGGQIVVAGDVGVANDDGVPGEQIVVARYDERGSPDPAFGRDGFSVLQLGFGSVIRHASSAARAVALLPDGRIVVAGRASARDGGDRAFVARLTASGRLDASFARQGRLLVQLGRASAARVASSSLEALVRRPDGRLLAAGSATDVAGGRELLLAAFSDAGALDGAFGRRGSVVTQFGAPGRGTAAPLSLARALALAPDGGALVAGAATGSALAAGATTGSALAARYDARGALDCGYGVRGRTLAFGGARFDPSSDGALAASLQPDGALVLAGRRAGGGLLLGRLLGGPSTTPAAAAAPRLVTLGARYAGNGRGYAYGLVDGGCSAVDVRFTVEGHSGRAGATAIRRVPGRFGPQVACAPLRGLRPGGRYRIRIVGARARGVRGQPRLLRAVKLRRAAAAQEGCA